jgi:hypothetical protein
MFKGRRFSWSGASSSDDDPATTRADDASRQIQAAAGQLASLIVFDPRYPRSIAFVSDAAENDEVASMLMQVADASRTPVQLIRLLVRAEFDMNVYSKETILRTNSLASKCFGIYARIVCRHYVCSHVLPIIHGIISSTDALEINPDLLSKQSHILALPESERAAAVADAIARNSIELARCVSSVIEGLSSPAALLDLPPSVLIILKFVGELSSEFKM